MENKSIYQIWKQQTLSITVHPSMINAEAVKVKDAIGSTRKSLDRRNYQSIFSLLCCIGLCIEFTHKCLAGDFTYARLFNACIFFTVAIYILRGWWIAYQWQQAEIYQDTKEYLSLSVETLRLHIGDFYRGFYGFYAFLVMANLASIGAGVSHTDRCIFLVVSVVCAVGWAFTYRNIQRSIHRYENIITIIEDTLSDLNADKEPASNSTI